MSRARNAIILLDETSFYHYVTRRVRRAFPYEVD